MPSPLDEPTWHQINIQFPADRSAAERAAFTQLTPVLAGAESAGLCTGWFFIRKPWWRFRYRPSSPKAAAEVRALLHDTAQFMQDAGLARRWVDAIYEPETHAFGGSPAMTAAHRLFHADSHHIAQHLAPGSAGADPRRRELALLLCSALLRGAGHDRYERGDIWAQVADLRPVPSPARPEQWHRLTAAVARLIAVDTTPGTTVRAGSLSFAHDWLTAFENAGRTLRTLAENGRFTRGPRAVAAHHVIFAWNRWGLPYQTQAHLALAAKQVTFVGS